MLPQKGVTMLSTEKTWWAQHLKFVKNRRLLAGLSRNTLGHALGKRCLMVQGTFAKID